MSKKGKGKKGNRGLTMMQTSLLYGSAATVLLTIVIWAFSPFHQGIHISLVIGSSITLFGIYGIDKAQAKKEGHRIPEKILHFWALLGGFPGGFVGMYFFRHKTRKVRFLLVMITSAVLHTVIYLISKR